MPEDDAIASVMRFFYAWFGVTLALFPLVATIEANAFGGRFGTLGVLVASVVSSFPVALEFLFSERNPRRVGEFVVVLVALYFIAILGQAGVYVAIGRSDTVAAVEVVILLATYVVTYVLVYRVGVARLVGSARG